MTHCMMMMNPPMFGSMESLLLFVWSLLIALFLYLFISVCMQTVLSNMFYIYALFFYAETIMPRLSKMEIKRKDNQEGTKAQNMQIVVAQPDTVEDIVG